jgi:hypothetical protein
MLFSSFPSRFSFLPTLLLLGSFLLCPSVSSAQEDVGLSLITSPLPISLITEPGKTVSTDIKVKNGGTREETLKISLMKFQAYEDSGKPKLLEPEERDEFLSWVSFSEPTFTLSPDEWKTITATFQVPETASFGYYYALVFSRAEEETPQQGETALSGGTAVLVLLEARVPQATRKVSVSQFSSDHTFYEFLPVTFTVKLENEGTVHIAPRGNIFIDQGETKDLAILEVNSEKGNILPHSSRSFEASWHDGFPRYIPTEEDGMIQKDEQGTTEMTLRWDWQDASKLRFGKYQAKLLLIYDDGTRDIPIEGTVSFWVVPGRIIALIIFNFTLIIGLIFSVIRLRRRLKQITRAQKSSLQ